MNPEQGRKRKPECPFTFQGIPQENRMAPGQLAGVAWIGRPCDASCALFDGARGLPCLQAAVADLSAALRDRALPLAAPAAVTLYGDPSSSGGT